MGLRNSTSVNALTFGVRLAPGGSFAMVLDYRTYGPDGRPRAVDPTLIEVVFTKPSGGQIIAIYPYNGEADRLEIVKAWDGHYTLAVPVDEVGRWKWSVITNAGGGPGEDGEFEVVSVS